MDSRSVDSSTHVTLLSQYPRNSFHAGEKAGVVLLDLSDAYDTVWLRGLNHELYCSRYPIVTPYVRFIIEPELHIQHHAGKANAENNGVKNGVPQGSVVPSMLFNIYISDLPSTCQ